MIDPLLSRAIADNVAWCRAVCATHGSRERLSASVWGNLQASPPFYPNIISLAPDAQADVLALIGDVSASVHIRGWGIKDSFGDLSLSTHGFTPVVSASWYGGLLPEHVTPSVPLWARITSPSGLAAWERAWGGDPDSRIFKDGLLADERITFWTLQSSHGIDAGFISFAGGQAIGLSNWFASDNRPGIVSEALEVVASVFSGLPVVFWTEETLDFAGTSLDRLGSLRVWCATD